MASDSMLAGATPRRADRGRPGRFSRHAMPYAMLAPALALLAGVVLYPIGYGLWLAFQDKNLMSLEAVFVGFANFQQLAGDRVFLASAVRTIRLTITCVVLVMLAGLGLAALLNARQVRGRRVLRSLFFLPWLTPTIVAATVWSWLYNPASGYINQGLKASGVIDAPVQFLANPAINMYSIAVPIVWRGYPFTMLVLLAALQAIDQSLYEAAAIDGASAWQRFRSITLPSLAAPLAILTLLQTIWVFNHFDIPYQMTGGGPARTTELLSTYAYTTVFGGMEQGYGAAIATVMFATLVVFAGFYIRLAVNRSEELAR